jgi:lipid II:glycine glycyltransferase (peptidoglycan interpeptide bridge formation enzyme)
MDRMLERALPVSSATGARAVDTATQAPEAGAYDLALETSEGTTAWDEFVATAENGHHAQSSTWARAKGVLGWRAVRLVLRDGDRIVAGAQVLIRDVRPFGRVGTCAHGPLVTSPDPRLVEAVHQGLLDLGRSERIRYLKVQPPLGSGDLCDGLRDRGWTPSGLSAAPSATVRVDLDAPEDEILARMRQSTRKKIRQGERRGLVLREGRRDDFAAYHRIIEATSRRQGFTPYPSDYYETLWESFADRDGTCLLLAELDGEVLSATLVIAFGGVATCKMGGWSGGQSRVRPNEPMHFAAMRWAKRIGAHQYDFDGIDRGVANAVQRGGELPEEARRGVAHFKLGFGGRVVLLPETLDIGPGPLMRPLVRAAAPRLEHFRDLAHRVAGRGR